jgi:hypothetical protein
MRKAHRAVVTIIVGAAGFAVACSGQAYPRSSPGFSLRPVVVITTPPSTTGPYVSVAVDNHFHDIHPSDPPSIQENRPFVVKNEGANLHNFTVAGTSISVDLEPGTSLTWTRIGDHLKPGVYHVYCRYHVSVGMVGTFFVTG